MSPVIETSALDVLTVRLFEQIDEDNMPWLLAAVECLRDAFGDALIDLVPAYTTLMLHYDIRRLDERQARQQVSQALQNLRPLAGEQGSLHCIPVWFDQRVGPDLARLSQRTGLPIPDIVRRYCARTYRTFALGFVPGFAYMGLVEPELAMPRLDRPRRRVPAGSLGIAERQTAIYPLTSPGGWNLIGRTPVHLFDRAREGFSLLQPGDRIRFTPIGREEFIALGGDDRPLDESETGTES